MNAGDSLEALVYDKPQCGPDAEDSSCDNVGYEATAHFIWQLPLNDLPREVLKPPTVIAWFRIANFEKSRVTFQITSMPCINF